MVQWKWINAVITLRLFPHMHWCYDGNRKQKDRLVINPTAQPVYVRNGTLTLQILQVILVHPSDLPYSSRVSQVMAGSRCTSAILIKHFFDTSWNISWNKHALQFQKWPGVQIVNFTSWTCSSFKGISHPMDESDTLYPLFMRWKLMFKCFSCPHQSGPLIKQSWLLTHPPHPQNLFFTSIFPHQSNIW